MFSTTFLFFTTLDNVAEVGQTGPRPPCLHYNFSAQEVLEYSMFEIGHLLLFFFQACPPHWLHNKKRVQRRPLSLSISETEGSLF